MIKIFLGLLLIALTLSAWALPPETQLSYKNGLFSHFTNQDLLQKNELIQKAIITIHGSERNAHTYYNSIESMARRLGELEQTIIISPHYKEVQDTRLASEFYFHPEGWLSGDPARNQKDVNSFEVMDYMVSLLANKTNFPNLKEIIITGHSAGGQLTQRYAVGSVLDQTYPEIHFRYVVANPGSYLYLTRNRPFVGPMGCAFNDYKFGLDKLNPYMSQRSVQEMITDYLQKDVVYFLGEADIRADDIDQTCPAVYQGRFRLERGQSYMRQMTFEFPENQHHLYTVPGVGHTQYGMYTSENGINVLFKKI